MSEPAPSLTFPVVDPSPERPEWMRGEPMRLRPLVFDGLDGPATPPPAPPAEPSLQPEDLAALELAQVRAALDAERASLEAERRALAAARARASELASELIAARSDALRSAREPLVDLAIGVAEAILGERLAREPRLHVALAQAALDALGEAEQVELRASPESYEVLIAALGGAEITHGGARVAVVADEELSGLGCMIHSGRARVDGRVKERLRAVRDAFVHELRSTGDGS